MKISKVMINLDIICDRIPAVSTLSNIVDIALKALFYIKNLFCPSKEKSDLHTSGSYITHITNKSFLRCCILLFPIIGNIIYGYLDYKASPKIEPSSKEPLPSNNVKHDSPPSKIKETLNLLFEYTGYSMDSLQIFRAESNLKWETMSAPVMKGIDSQGRPFIAIRVEMPLEGCDIGDQIQMLFKRDPMQKVIIFQQICLTNDELLDGGDAKNLWIEASGLSENDPKFFEGCISNAKNGDVAFGQASSITKINQLLQGYNAQDSRGRNWILSK